MMKSQYQQGNSKYSNCVIYCFMVDNFCQHIICHFRPENNYVSNQSGIHGPTFETNLS